MFGRASEVATVLTTRIEPEVFLPPIPGGAVHKVTGVQRDRAMFLRSLVQRHLSDTDRLMLCAAELGTKKRRTAFRSALLDVCQQCAFHISHQVAFWPYASEPCLWVADYSLWAVVRHWERGDDRSLDLIRPMVRSQYDLFGASVTHYY